MFALKQNPSGEVELDLSNFVASMTTSKSAVMDKKICNTSYVDAELCVMRDDNVSMFM